MSGMASEKKNPTKKAAPAKKAAPVKKAPAKKAAPAKKTPAKKTPAKKAASVKSRTSSTQGVDSSDLASLLAALSAPAAKTEKKVKPKVSRAAETTTSALPRILQDRWLFAVVGASVLVALLAVFLVMNRPVSSGSRCSTAIESVREIIRANPDKAVMPTEELERTVSLQSEIGTYCAYNEGNQVITSEVVPWLGVTPPTSLPTQTSDTTAPSTSQAITSSTTP